MKIVIVGSSHAGICAGLRALEEYPEAEITLYDKRNQVSFVSQGIISYLAGQKSVLNQSSYSSVEELKAEIQKAIAAGVMTADPYKDFVVADNSESNYDKVDLHKNIVDNIVLVSPSGKPMQRETDLIDV